MKSVWEGELAQYLIKHPAMTYRLVNVYLHALITTLPLDKEPLNMRLGGPQSRPERDEEGYSVHLVASHITDCASPAGIMQHS
jgi:hypothetical protein